MGQGHDEHHIDLTVKTIALSDAHISHEKAAAWNTMHHQEAEKPPPALHDDDDGGKSNNAVDDEIPPISYFQLFRSGSARLATPPLLTLSTSRSPRSHADTLDRVAMAVAFISAVANGKRIFFATLKSSPLTKTAGEPLCPTFCSLPRCSAADVLSTVRRLHQRFWQPRPRHFPDHHPKPGVEVPVLGNR